MQVNRYNIAKPEEYTDSQGQTKTKWNNVGTITEFHKDDGSVGRKVEIPAIGLEAQAFPWQDRNEQAQQQTQQQAPQQSNQQNQYPDEQVNPEDIPF